jgi:hypothetical protein
LAPWRECPSEITFRVAPLRRCAIVGALVCAVVGAPALASASDDDPRATQETVGIALRRLGEQLDLYAAQAHRGRLAKVLTGVGVGATFLPTGFLLLGRTQDISHAFVIGLIVGGSAQLATVPLVFIRTRMDQIRDDFINRPTERDSATTVDEFEKRWSLAAAESAQRRTYVGTALFALGVTNLAAGVAFLLAPQGIFKMSRSAQDTWGGVTLGIGVPVATQGLSFLLEWSPEENAWQAYRQMNLHSGSASLRRTPSFSAVPVRGGAVAFATMAF